MSGSSGQSNGYVAKISAHIVKKVSDKLNSLFNTEREKYESFWDDVKPFVEYAGIRDNKFFSKVKDVILYKTTEGKFMTLAEYAANEHYDNTVYYTDDKQRQSKYVSMFASQGVPVVEFDKLIDVQFVSFAESELKSDDKYKDIKFVRVDSGVADILKDSDKQTDEEQSKKLCDFFKETLGKGDGLKISCDHLKDSTVPAVLNLSEQSRRFSDMMKMYGGGMGSMPVEETLVLNLSNPLIGKIADKITSEETPDELSKSLATQAYMLALVAQRPLEPDELSKFISQSSELFAKLD